MKGGGPVPLERIPSLDSLCFARYLLSSLTPSNFDHTCIIALHKFEKNWANSFVQSASKVRLRSLFFPQREFFRDK